MNRLIGITGGMSSGKTTISNEILKSNPQFIYIDVDVFRRNLFNNNSYVKELKEVIPELNQYDLVNTNILNQYIYSNKQYMNEYKKIMYKYLFEYIKQFDNKTILVDWALIINDNIQDLFDKIIYVKASEETRLKRLANSDLPEEEVLRRFKLQKIANIERYLSDNFMIFENESSFDIDQINHFINGMECKFTLPNNEGKAIWEITHQCNYGCSYCIFSCNNKKIDNELTTEECFHVIDELVLRGFKHLKITGGEPFIRKDIIEILRYASGKLITDISTNASLITPEKVRLLNEIKLKMIHVSLDGNRLQHESVRGNNTYDRTIKGLEALNESTNKVRIGSVIHFNNQSDLENLVIDSERLSADEIIFSIMEPVFGQDKSLIRTLSNEQLIEIIELLKKKYQDRIIVNYNFGKQPNFVHTCPAGDKFLYINNFGQVSPCPWVHEVDKSCISDSSLRDKSLEEILKDKKLVKFLSYKSEGKCYGKI